jgi:hypothetical protein
MILRLDSENRDRKRKITRIDKETEKITQENRILIKIKSKIFYHEDGNQFRGALTINKKEEKL